MRKPLLTFAFAGLLGLFACTNDESPEDGNDQIERPVQNSGAETEMERATEAVSQDTTGKEVIAGDDDDEK